MHTNAPESNAPEIDEIAPDFTYVDVGRRFPKPGLSSRPSRATCSSPPRSTAAR
jgi:hypothetical protein